MSRQGCSVEGCDRPLHGRGYCQLHFSRWRRHGDPLAGPPERADNPADCPTCEDLGWLLDTGEHPELILTRLGITRNSLYIHLRRHQQPDLAERFTQARARTAA